MSLTRQVYIISTATDAFYEPKEQQKHKTLLNLYGLRNALESPKVAKKNPVEVDKDFWLKTVKKLIKEEKVELGNLLDERLKDYTPRQLRPEAIRDKSIISLFESSLTRALGLETNKLSKSLIVLNVFFFQVFNSLVRDGFIFEGERYIFLTASAGQIRTKRAVFIKEVEYRRIEKKIMCGLSVEDINAKGGINPNKFLAYLALCNSATDIWEDFDIDRSIVVDDFEANVLGQVDFIDETDYSITRKEMQVPIPHMDGCGIMLEDTTRMVRLPWVKGLLVTFPFDEFIKEKCDGECVVYDIYGEEHNIIKENIKYIFTKSQFKLHKYYSSWSEYKENFKKYQCEACYCNLEDPYIPKAKINYQMLQTLSDMRDDEIEKITRRTVDEINKVGNDYQTTMRLLGATDYNQNPNYFQRALLVYPELFRDTYHKEILKQTKKSLVKQAKGGRLAVNGRYQFISPDLYAFCEWLFLGNMNPKGLLKDGEVYSRLNSDGVEVACLRSPHLYREWAVRKNNRAEEIERWFGRTKCVYTSCHDLLSKILQFDCDGDKSLVVQDRTLTAIAKRNMKDIVPLAYNLRKAKGGMLNSDELYEGMIHAYTGGNIGPVSNNISKIWNSGDIGEEQLNTIKWLCMSNNQIIDYAKTLWKSDPPKSIDKIIKSYTKASVPHFFIYAKDKEAHQVEPANNSTMNRISAVIPNPRVKYSKSIGKFDYTMLMNRESDFSIKRDPILDRYDYWLTHRWSFGITSDGFGNYEEKMQYVDTEDWYIYNKIKQEFLNLGKKDYIINTLVNYVYTVKKQSNKKLLWACFGKEMVENLKNNVAGLEKICPICGKRFKAVRGEQDIYCSDECAKIGDKQRHIERKFGG